MEYPECACISSFALVDYLVGNLKRPTTVSFNSFFFSSYTIHVLQSCIESNIHVLQTFVESNMHVLHTCIE